MPTKRRPSEIKFDNLKLTPKNEKTSVENNSNWKSK